MPRPSVLPRLYLWATERLYNEWAWAYDLVSWVVSLGRWSHWRRMALEYVAGGRVLEIGFGTGELLIEMAERGWFRLRAGSSAAMHRVTAGKMRRRGIWAPRIRGCAQALPFADGSLDVLIATFPAGYILSPDTLQEAARVLRDPESARAGLGGRLIVAGFVSRAGDAALHGAAPGGVATVQGRMHWSGGCRPPPQPGSRSRSHPPQAGASLGAHRFCQLCLPYQYSRAELAKSRLAGVRARKEPRGGFFARARRRARGPGHEFAPCGGASMPVTLDLQSRATEGATVEQMGPGHWRLSISPGPGSRYGVAQLDDYMSLTRSAFHWRPPLSLSLRARVSHARAAGHLGLRLLERPLCHEPGVEGSGPQADGPAQCGLVLPCLSAQLPRPAR